MKIIMAILLFIAICKGLYYRLAVMAVLMYFAERDQELPDAQTIREYCEKVAMKFIKQ